MSSGKSTQHRKLKLRRLINDVRRKYLAFKLGRSEADESINRIISPITNRLDKMTQHLKQEPLLAIKQPKSSTVMKTVGVIEEKNPLRIHSKAFKKEPDSSNATPPPPSFVEENYNEKFDDSHHSNNLEESLNAYPENVQHFIRQSLNKETQIDFTYGPRYEHRTSSWSLGGSSLNFDLQSGDIIVDDKFHFPNSDGLMKLLFIKEPKGFTREDEENYKQILNITNVHRREFNPSKQIKSNIGYKYKYIIKKLGGGMMRYNDKAIEYRYWNNINELVDRLCLLHASKEAGNNSNDNEIEAIVEELREAGIIY